MPQFLLSVWHDDSYELDFSSDDAQRVVAQVDEFNAALTANGSLIHAGGLQPKESASVAHWADGEVAMSVGPYSDAPEQMGGFWIIETTDRASAQEWAERASAACEGPVELRPLQGEA